MPYITRQLLYSRRLGVTSLCRRIYFITALLNDRRNCPYAAYCVPARRVWIKPRAKTNWRCARSVPRQRPRVVHAEPLLAPRQSLRVAHIKRAPQQFVTSGSNSPRREDYWCFCHGRASSSLFLWRHHNGVHSLRRLDVGAAPCGVAATSRRHIGSGWFGHVVSVQGQGVPSQSLSRACD